MRALGATPNPIISANRPWGLDNSQRQQEEDQEEGEDENTMYKYIGWSHVACVMMVVAVVAFTCVHV
jgi:hypothetical protein